MSKNTKKTKTEASQQDEKGFLCLMNQNETESTAEFSQRDTETRESEEKESAIPISLADITSASIRDEDMQPLTFRKDLQFSDPYAQNKNEISDMELKALFDRYLGDTAETPSSSGYDTVHQKIVDAQDRAGVSPMSKPDVGKNIDEAEKYVDAMAQKATQKKQMPVSRDLFDDTACDHGMSIENTEQLRVFVPKGNTSDTVVATTMEETKVIQTRNTVGLNMTDMPTDTAMMKAFGLEPKPEDIMGGKNLFDEIKFSDADGAMDKITTDEARTSDEDVPEERIDEKPVKEKAKTDNTYEYVSASQNKEIFRTFKEKYQSAKIRLVLAAALMLFLGLLENVSMIRDIFGSNVNLIAVDWFLTLAAAALVFERMLAAIKSLGKFEFDCDSVTLFAFILSLAATGVTLFTSPVESAVYLYNFPFAGCVFLNVLNAFISLRQDIYSFKVVSSPKVKNVLARASFVRDKVPEREDFGNFIGEDRTVHILKKTDFVSSFFAHRKEPANSKFLLKIFIPECLIFSVIFFLVSYFILKNTLSESLSTAYSSFLMSAPFSAFIAYSYPTYLASRRAYAYRSAMIGDKTHENYVRTAVIAVRDEEAFPVEKTKVKSLKLYGDRKIENVMYYAAGVYSKLGGPLATVFKQATLNSKISAEIELLEISTDGVSALVDGKTIVIGQPAYMEEQCFEIMHDEGDEAYAGNTNKRILYLACEQSVIAKFYVQYATTADFLNIAHSLSEAGVALSIRTADPCIDNGILQASKATSKMLSMMKVVKGVFPEEKADKISAKTGGIVSVGSVADIIKTFLICSKIDNVRKLNFILKTAASILGIAIMVLVLFTGNASSMLSVFPALYQLFWLIPVYIISKIYI